MQCLFLYPQVGYSQFELMTAVEQLQLHCGPLLKEVLVAPQVFEVSGKLWFPLGRRRGHHPLPACPAEVFPAGPSLELIPIHSTSLLTFIKLFLSFFYYSAKA